MFPRAVAFLVLVASSAATAQVKERKADEALGRRIDHRPVNPSTGIVGDMRISNRLGTRLETRIRSRIERFDPESDGRVHVPQD